MWFVGLVLKSDYDLGKWRKGMYGIHLLAYQSMIVGEINQVQCI